MNTMIISLTDSHPAPAGLIDYLTEYARVHSYPRRTLLLNAGEVGRKIFFVECGLLRKYYNDGTKDITSGFAAEQEVCLSPESWLTGQPSLETIEVMEDAIISSIDYDDFSYLIREYPVIGLQYRRRLEQYIVDTGRRMRAMWMRSAEERYGWLEDRSPAWLGRVQGRHLATYLGMTEVTLSYIRSRRRKLRQQSPEHEQTGI